jgi:hypothetical protein
VTKEVISEVTTEVTAESHCGGHQRGHHSRLNGGYGEDAVEQMSFKPQRIVLMSGGMV